MLGIEVPGSNSGKFCFDIFCTPFLRYVPEPLLAGFDKPTFCHFWQLSKLPKLATSEAAKIGNLRSCQNWQLAKLPKLATSEAAKIGNFKSCQNWQLLELLQKCITSSSMIFPKVA